MNTNQQCGADSHAGAPLSNGKKELYRAPQIKVHGKLERLTLSASNSNSGNTPGGGNDLPEG